MFDSTCTCPTCVRDVSVRVRVLAVITWCVTYMFATCDVLVMCDDTCLFCLQFLYFTYGTKDVLERECKHLDKKLKVRD